MDFINAECRIFSVFRSLLCIREPVCTFWNHHLKPRSILRFAGFPDGDTGDCKNLPCEE